MERGKIRKHDLTYGFVGEGHPRGGWGWERRVGNVRSVTRVASVGS